MDVPMDIVEGGLSGAGLRVAIVASRFNDFVVDRLIDGATDALIRTGVAKDAIVLFRAPGSFEVPQVLRRVVERPFDAVICLGAVIRGDTPHFELVVNAVGSGVAEIARHAPMAVTFGVLTTDTLDQAISRAGAKAGNKGFEAALAAVELANLFRLLRDPQRTR